jgi:Vitamin B12 dependent methionine synthase, activation domain
MINSTYHFDFKDLRLSPSVIEEVLGYKEGEDRELVASLVEETLAESSDIINIKAQFKIFDDIHVDSTAKLLEINKIIFSVEKIVFGQVKKSESIAVFLCTAGEEIGLRCRKAMQERDFLRGYIYDVIGSEIVEAAADLMQADLERKIYDSGKKITNRYSPGYCGWNVAEQHKLFSLIPDNYCGIKLTPSALMDPVKSVSGIIGIGKNVRYNPYTCRMCKQEDCAYRRVREKMIQ